jgi:hypothetical protein
MLNSTLTLLDQNRRRSANSFDPIEEIGLRVDCEKCGRETDVSGTKVLHCDFCLSAGWVASPPCPSSPGAKKPATCV